MLWFRHLNKAHNDPFIVDLMNKFYVKTAAGNVPYGYHVWFITLEILAAEDALNRPAVISAQYLTRSMFLDFEKIKSVFSYAQQKGKLRVKFLKDEVSIFCPNLKVYMDEWTKKKLNKKTPELLRSNSGVTPDKNGTDTDTDTDTEQKQIQKTPKEKNSGLFNGYMHFKDAYKTSKNTEYKTQNPDKDRELCESMVKTFGQTDFFRAVEGFFKSTDNFIIGRGYDVVALNTKFKGFLSEPHKKKNNNLSAKETLEKIKQDQLKIDERHRVKNGKT